MNTPANKSPDVIQYDLIKTLFKIYKQEDPTLAICWWKKASKSIIANLDASDFPNDFDEFCKIFAKGLRTRSKGTNWFKIRTG